MDDSKEATSKEDLNDAVVTEDDNSDEAKSDENDNTDNDSQEGISDCDYFFFIENGFDFDLRKLNRKFI